MLQVNHERVAKLLQGLASFTDSEEGVTHLAYSPLDKKGSELAVERGAGFAFANPHRCCG